MILRVILFLSLLFGTVQGWSEEKTVVYKVDIKDEIGPGTWRMMQKSFREAEKAGARCIILHMNTYGGMVVYADSMRSLILNSPKPVWVFIDNNAASAGALISIACDKIYMREGANIGAATVVNQAGEAMPDKYQSYMRSMIRSTAQAQGKDTIINGQDTTYRWKRDPHIAEAMVDQSIYIQGLNDSGRVVTFTPHEAMKYGFCDGIASDVDDVLRLEHIDNYVIGSYVPTAMDKIIGFLINPIVQGLIIMLIVGGIYFEFQTPGIGFPLIAALTGCLLYFAPLYLEGLANHWEILAFIAGVVLLMLEIFVIPGFGVAGILGIALIIGALVLGAVDNFSFDFLGDVLEDILASLFLVISFMLVGLGLSVWLGAKLIVSRKLAFALHSEQRPEDGFVGVDMTVGEQVGKSGTAFTDLRPAGKVVVEGEIYDAASLLGDYIVQGSPVVVKKYQAGQLYVVKG